MLILRKFGSLYKVLLFWQFRGQFLHENTVFAPNPSSNLRLSIEDSKVCEISKSTLGLDFDIFRLCIPITQNLIFRQLVPFDMLSHIYLLFIYTCAKDVDMYYLFQQTIHVETTMVDVRTCA